MSDPTSAMYSFADGSTMDPSRIESNDRNLETVLRIQMEKAVNLTEYRNTFCPYVRKEIDNTVLYLLAIKVSQACKIKRWHVAMHNFAGANDWVASLDNLIPGGGVGWATVSSPTLSAPVAPSVFREYFDDTERSVAAGNYIVVSISKTAGPVADVVVHVSLEIEHSHIS